MKQIILIVLSLELLSSVCFAGKDLDLKDKKVKMSYSVGYQIGKDFKRQGMDINPEVLLNGIQDALAGNEPVLTLLEMRNILMDLQKKVIADQEKKRKAEAEKNLAEGKAFLANNGKRKGVKTLPSGLQYKIITEGSVRTPEANDTFTIHYRGTLIDGTEFDSSYTQDKPATFRADRLIAGWKEALQLMKEGSKWQLFIPPDLGYGERSVGRIGPNSTLIFEIELISIY